MIVFKNRSEWLEYRKRGFGGSDATILHGLSSYCTPYQLGKQKLSSEVIDPVASFAAQKGIDREPIARSKFAALHNVIHGTDETFDAAFLQMDLPHMFASLDGISLDKKIILEIKSLCDAQSEQDKAERKKLTAGQQKHLDVDLGIMPPMYIPQVQHNLLVSGAELAYFISFDGESLKYCEVIPDINFMKIHLEVCTKAWERLRRGENLPPIDADYSSLRFSGAKKLAQDYRHAKARGDIAVAAEIKAEIKKWARADGRELLKIDGLKVEEL